MGVTQMLVGSEFDVDMIGVGVANRTVVVVGGLSVPVDVVDVTIEFISSGLRLMVILLPAPE